MLLCGLLLRAGSTLHSMVFPKTIGQSRYKQREFATTICSLRGLVLLMALIGVASPQNSLRVKTCAKGQDCLPDERLISIRLPFQQHERNFNYHDGWLVENLPLYLHNVNGQERLINRNTSLRCDNDICSVFGPVRYKVSIHLSRPLISFHLHNIGHVPYLEGTIIQTTDGGSPQFNNIPAQFLSQTFWFGQLPEIQLDTDATIGCSGDGLWKAFWYKEQFSDLTTEENSLSYSSYGSVDDGLWFHRTAARHSMAVPLNQTHFLPLWVKEPGRNHSCSWQPKSLASWTGIPSLSSFSNPSHLLRPHLGWSNTSDHFERWNQLNPLGSLGCSKNWDYARTGILQSVGVGSCRIWQLVPKPVLTRVVTIHLTTSGGGRLVEWKALHTQTPEWSKFSVLEGPADVIRGSINLESHPLLHKRWTHLAGHLTTCGDIPIGLEHLENNPYPDFGGSGFFPNDKPPGSIRPGNWSQPIWYWKRHHPRTSGLSRDVCQHRQLCKRWFEDDLLADWSNTTLLDDLPCHALSDGNQYNGSPYILPEWDSLRPRHYLAQVEADPNKLRVRKNKGTLELQAASGPRLQLGQQAGPWLVVEPREDEWHDGLQAHLDLDISTLAVSIFPNESLTQHQLFPLRFNHSRSQCNLIKIAERAENFNISGSMSLTLCPRTGPKDKAISRDYLITIQCSNFSEMVQGARSGRNWKTLLTAFERRHKDAINQWKLTIQADIKAGDCLDLGAFLVFNASSLPKNVTEQTPDDPKPLVGRCHISVNDSVYSEIALAKSNLMDCVLQRLDTYREIRRVWDETTEFARDAKSLDFWDKLRICGEINNQLEECDEIVTWFYIISVGLLTLFIFGLPATFLALSHCRQ